MCGAGDGCLRERSRKSGELIERSSASDLDELFVRYWENDLSHDDAALLQERLAADADAREAFQLFCLQTIVAGELPPVAQAMARAEAAQARKYLPVLPMAGWSRRRLLASRAAALASCFVEVGWDVSV